MARHAGTALVVDSGVLSHRGDMEPCGALPFLRACLDNSSTRGGRRLYCCRCDHQGETEMSRKLLAVTAAATSNRDVDAHGNAQLDDYNQYLNTLNSRDVER